MVWERKTGEMKLRVGMWGIYDCEPRSVRCLFVAWIWGNTKSCSNFTWAHEIIASICTLELRIYRRYLWKQCQGSRDEASEQWKFPNNINAVHRVFWVVRWFVLTLCPQGKCRIQKPTDVLCRNLQVNGQFKLWSEHGRTIQIHSVDVICIQAVSNTF
jgi:hypothetical protein